MRPIVFIHPDDTSCIYRAMMTNTRRLITSKGRVKELKEILSIGISLVVVPVFLHLELDLRRCVSERSMKGYWELTFLPVRILRLSSSCLSFFFSL